MIKEKENISTEELLDNIIEGIRKVKGKEIINIDLEGLDSRVSRYFIVCHGDSNTHVSAIADSVSRETKDNTGISSLHKEGYENSHWILLDYGSIVVHVFQKEYRDFYRLEDLWADGKIEKLD
jgi:ribosome-associated protein